VNSDKILMLARVKELLQHLHVVKYNFLLCFHLDCPLGVDIVFVVDVSADVSEQNFTILKHWLKGIADYLR